MKTLNESDVSTDAMQQFRTWFQEALDSGVPEVNALTLATSSPEGRPSARVVLLKGVTDEGFVFFTNYASRKGQELERNPWVSMVFLWHELERQVRIEGRAEKISRAESEMYFYSRPVLSQVSALVSPQSQVIDGKEGLETLHAAMMSQYEGGVVPFPDQWGGYLVRPEHVEFWQGRANRFHDRLVYRKTLKESNWIIERLAP